MAAMEFDEVYEENRGVLNPGRLKLQSNSIVFKNLRTGKVETLGKDDIENVKWMKRSRGYGLKFTTKSETVFRYDGFKDTDLERLKEFLTTNFGKNIEMQKLSTNGWNWGKGNFSAGNLSFDVDNKTGFEVPLKNVSNASKGKNEVTLQFHQADDAKVSLMEIRFFIPQSETENDSVEEFHQNVMKGAAVITAKGDAICSLSNINCLVPRGRHELRFYPGFVDLRGKSYDYKIPYNQITRGFLLPHKDNRQMFFVLSLDPPVKHGQTRYQYVIFAFYKEEETTVELSLTPEVIQEKYGNNLQKKMSGSYHDIVSRLFRAITEQRITVPGSFSSKNGAKCVSCAYKASAGLLYPLERGFIYIHKPPLYMHHDDIASVSFNRSNAVTGRTFDFEITMNNSGISHVFSNIEKEEYKHMSDFLVSKDLKIHSAGKDWDKKGGFGVDKVKDHDAYLNYVKSEGQEREDDDDESDDDEEEEDEDFNAASGGDDDDDLEYDSNASIKSSDEEDPDSSKKGDENGKKSSDTTVKKKKSSSVATSKDVGKKRVNDKPSTSSAVPEKKKKKEKSKELPHNPEPDEKCNACKEFRTKLKRRIRYEPLSVRMVFGKKHRKIPITDEPTITL
ncbi:unnamed protein product [Didymodactylos carnosus]|uniref:FACT complex subunit SSRP1 n=1 Tax=Didymodactylos carnosus TaxID=1234261 RepID=A0A8S2GIP6_9BILA|nr:unnamed protein product [Didymodactylos carnosus]CAF3522932.1 unnamed protein product [Didymodactylos carnosus]